MTICIYTTSTCPKCVILKKYFDKLNVEYDTADMSTPEALTNLRVEGCFAMSAPVLQVDTDEFFEESEMFDDMVLDEQLINKIVTRG